MPDSLMLKLVAVGFGVGALLFVIGAVFSAAPTCALVANSTYAVGAVLFTIGAAVQWRAAVAHRPPDQGLRSRAEWDFRNPDWVSAVIQLVGTLEFNVMTIRALLLTLGADRYTVETIWRPDAVGSALFLISSVVAWHPMVRARRHGLNRGRSAWICLLNVLGSVAFGVSALADFPAETGALSLRWTNVGTALGGAAFLCAAGLLWPGRRRVHPNADQ